MLSNKPKSIIAIASLVLTSSLSINAWADVQEDIEKTFNVEKGSKFYLDNINGGVTVERSRGNDVVVYAEKSAKNDKQLARMKVVMSQKGNSVYVKTENEKNNSWGNDSYGKVTYKVMLPDNMSLTDINLVNGSFKLEDIDGKIVADLVNGSITAKNIQGNGDFNSVNGSVKVSYQNVSDVSEIELSTVNGSIKLSLPSDVSASVKADTNHGSIKNDFGLAVEKSFFSGKSLRGTIGSGDINIDLESVNGSIKVLNQ